MMMHDVAIDYLGSCCNKTQVVMCLAYRLLRNKCVFNPVTDKDDTFWADVCIKGQQIVVRYNKNKFTENGDSFENPGIKELAWVLLHEATHVLFGDFENIDLDKDPLLLNIAEDARNNACIINDNITNVSSYLHPCMDDLDGTDTVSFVSGVFKINDRKYTKEEIYELLKEKFKDKMNQEASNNPSEGGGSNGNPSSESSGAGSNGNDSQESGENSSTSNTSSDTNGNGKSQDSKDSNGAPGNKTVEEILKSKIFNGGDRVKVSIPSKVTDPILKDKITEVVKYEVAKVVEEVAEEFSDETGKEVSSILSRIGRVIPTKTEKNNWVKVVSKYIDGCGSKSSSRLRTWRRPNKRRSDIPGYKELRYKEIAVFVDISGSMCEAMKNAINNVAVLSQFNGGISRMVLWNTKLYKEYTRLNKKKVTEAMAYSGGGTELSEGLEYINKRINKDTILIVISDLDDWDEAKFVDTINKICKFRTVIVGYPQYNYSETVLQKIKSVNVALK